MNTLLTLLVLTFSLPFLAHAQEDLGGCEICNASVSILFADFSTDQSIQWQTDYLLAKSCEQGMGNETVTEMCIDDITTWWNLVAKQIFGSNKRASEVCGLFNGGSCQRDTWDCNTCPDAVEKFAITLTGETQDVKDWYESLKSDLKDNLCESVLLGLDKQECKAFVDRYSANLLRTWLALGGEDGARVCHDYFNCK